MRVRSVEAFTADARHAGNDKTPETHVLLSGPPFVEGVMIATIEREFEAEYVGLFVLAQRAAARVVGDASVAEEIAAETLARALVKWARVQSYCQPFVIRVATNLALDTVRRRTPRLDPVAPPDAPEDGVLIRLALVAALGRLSHRQRQVLVLRYVIGLDEREVADVLQINPGTVKTHVRRGLQALRRRFGVVPEEVRLATYDSP
jgi:RNA polymerase sigma factor (sigma-70 family)